MYASFNARAIGLTTLDPVTTLELAAGAGFKGVDLMVRDLVDSGVDPSEVRSRMDDHGLKAGAFPCPIDWRRDESSYLSGLHRLPEICAAARTLGLTRTGTWVMPRIPDRNWTRERVAHLHLDRIGTIARVMNDYGIRLGLEVIGVETFQNGQGDPFVARIQDLDIELGDIWQEAPNLGILLDCFHLYAAGETTEAGLAWGVDRIVWVHVADLPAGANPDQRQIIDAYRGLPGDLGAVDVGAFLHRLAHEGYNGPVTVEPLSHCQALLGLSPVAQARLVKQSLDRVWPSI